MSSSITSSNVQPIVTPRNISTNSITTISNAAIGRDIRQLSNQVSEVEKLGKIVEKQFKKEIRHKFGEHMPKEFIEGMVNQRVHTLLEMVADGTIHEAISHENELIKDFYNSLHCQPKNLEDTKVLRLHGIEITLSKRKHGGWKARIRNLQETPPRVKTITVSLSSKYHWEMFKKKVLTEVVQQRLEHRHVHSAKKHARKIVNGYKHSALPVALEGVIKGMENFSHSNKAMPSKEFNTVGGNFAAATVVTGLLEMNEGKNQILKSHTIEKTVKTFSVQDMQDPRAVELKNMQKQLRRRAIGSLLIGGINTLEGASTLAYTSVVKTAAIVGATSVLAAALGGTGGGLAIAAGATSGAIHAYGLKKVNKQLQQLKRLGGSSTFNNDNVLLEDFIAMQKRMLNNRKMNKIINLSSDTLVIAGGAVMVAALVTGATTLGVSAGAIFGGALLGYGSAHGYKAYKNRQYRSEQKDLVRGDVTRLHHGRKLKSDVGILIRLADKVKAERGQEKRPYTDAIVRGYLKMDPRLFLNMMKDVENQLRYTVSEKKGHARITCEVNTNYL